MKKYPGKKVFAFFMAMVTAFSVLTITVVAEDTVRWTASDTMGGGTLTGYEGVLPEVLVIPEEVDGIEIEILDDRLFMNCGNIREVVLPDSVFLIGYAAFANCAQLEKVVSDTGVSFIDGSAFANCARLTQAPRCCDGLSDSAFRNCTSLQSVDLTYAFSIGDKAFAGCTSLREITMSANCIGDDAFDQCTALTTVYDMRYMHEYDPYYAMREGWSFKGNDAFFNAEHIRVHYANKDWEDHLVEHRLNSRGSLEITVDRELRDGEVCYWWLDDETTPDVVGMETASEDGFSGDTVWVGGNQPGTAWVKAEVVDADGDVVYMETHRIDVSVTFLQQMMQLVCRRMPILCRWLRVLFPDLVY